MGDPEKLDSLGRTTTTYTDHTYQVADGTTNINVFYDVQAYYEPDNTYADHYYQSIYAECQANIQTIDETMSASVEEVPISYSLDNYPNPFNPSTTIRYQIPEKDFVTIKVYDMLGEEVSTLVEEEKPAGIHSIEFNAGNLPSGVYIYSLRTNQFQQSKKMILTK
ncbi:MAG: hypothetical protein A2V66_03195 [Ignavibacteria bacterium RBG_13_36_8]|nr:MAG: hypothetical protein A2V66_03195 [Ignavibacteria bacterium RBG_13_36_8]